MIDQLCPVCHGSEAVLVSERDRRGMPLRTVACLRCGLYRNDPMPTVEELKAFHEREYRQSYKGNREPRARSVLRSRRLAAQRREQLAEYFPAGGRVLDAGSGSGEFLAELQGRGYEVQGLEADVAFGEFARRRYGVAVESGGLLDAQFEKGWFDGITLFHVLEHQPEPVEVLRRLGEWLKPGGVLVVEVPNLDSVNQHPAKRFHFAHVLGFTETSLRLSVHEAGFRVVAERRLNFGRDLQFVLRRGVEPLKAWEAPRPRVTSGPGVALYYLNPLTYVRFGKRMGQFLSEYLAAR